MRIGIVAFPYDKGQSGQWQYIESIIERAAVLDPDDEYYIFTHFDFELKSENAKQILLRHRWINNPLVNILWHQIYLPYAVKKYGIDLLHLPAGNRRLLYVKPCKIITTVHDLAQYHVKYKYGFFREIYTKKILPYAIHNLDKVIAISRSTKNDIVDKWNIPERSIDVLPNGLDLCRYDDLDAKNSKKYIEGRFSVSGKFILYVSRIESPGKNHVGLIRAFSKLKNGTNSSYKLVFAGADWNGADLVKKEAEKSKFSDDIIFLGYIPGEDLPHLYTACELLVFPSFCEGFGVPILEALAAGTPVVCSDRSSMPEVLGGCGLLFDPSDIDDMCEKMKRMILDENLRNDCIEKGRVRAKLFEWDRIAASTTEIYRGVVNV